jgi:lipopolysaccharide transport system permease protein
MAKNLHTEVRTYLPDSELRRPFRLMREMVSDLWSGRELAWRLFVRDTAAQYRQSALGYFWVILPPLATSAIFILLNSADVLVSNDLGMSYPVYVLTGTVLFGIFSDAMAAPLKTVAASRPLLIKVRFPRESLLLAAGAASLLGFAIRVVLLIICLIVLQAHIAPTALLAIVPALGLMLLGIVVGVLMVPLGALYQDITLGLVLLTSALMLITPVAFAPPSTGALATIMHYNPLTPLLLCARDLLITGDMTYLPATLLISAVCIVLLGIGWVLFRLAIPIIVERLGS